MDITFQCTSCNTMFFPYFCTKCGENFGESMSHVIGLAEKLDTLSKYANKLRVLQADLTPPVNLKETLEFTQSHKEQLLKNQHNQDFDEYNNF